MHHIASYVSVDRTAAITSPSRSPRRAPQSSPLASPGRHHREASTHSEALNQFVASLNKGGINSPNLPRSQPHASSPSQAVEQYDYSESVDAETVTSVDSMASDAGTRDEEHAKGVTVLSSIWFHPFAQQPPICTTAVLRISPFLPLYPSIFLSIYLSISTYHSCFSLTLSHTLSLFLVYLILRLVT